MSFLQTGKVRFALSVFAVQIYDISASLSEASFDFCLLTFVKDLGTLLLLVLCASVKCWGQIFPPLSTVELLFDEGVIPALIESLCLLSPFNGLPVIIPPIFFFLFSKGKSSEI